MLIEIEKSIDLGTVRVDEIDCGISYLSEDITVTGQVNHFSEKSSAFETEEV